MSTPMFKDKVLLITGGTGSFGNAVLRRFIDSDIGEIRVLSLDEKKQDDMRRRYNSRKLKFYIGDVRDLPLGIECGAGGGLYFPCCGAKASALLRISSDGGLENQCAGHGECARGDDEKSDRRQVAQQQFDRVVHDPVRQRAGFARVGGAAFY